MEEVITSPEVEAVRELEDETNDLPDFRFRLSNMADRNISNSPSIWWAWSDNIFDTLLESVDMMFKSPIEKIDTDEKDTVIKLAQGFNKGCEL